MEVASRTIPATVASFSISSASLLAVPKSRPFFGRFAVKSSKAVLMHAASGVVRSRAMGDRQVVSAKQLNAVGGAKIGEIHLPIEMITMQQLWEPQVDLCYSSG